MGLILTLIAHLIVHLLHVRLVFTAMTSSRRNVALLILIYTTEQFARIFIGFLVRGIVQSGNTGIILAFRRRLRRLEFVGRLQVILAE